MSKKKSKENINLLLQTEIEKAQSLGFNLYLIDAEVYYTDSERMYGCCKHYRNNRCVIILAKWMRTHKKSEISAVLMHEVLHAVVGNKGHGKEWKNCVRQVCLTFSYKGYEDCHLCEHPYSKIRPRPRKRKAS